MRLPSGRSWCAALFTLLVFCLGTLWAHKHTLHRFEKGRQLALARAAQQAEDPGPGVRGPTCQLTVELVDGRSQESLPGLLRVTNQRTGKRVRLGGLFERDLNWYAMPARATLTVPQSEVLIEVFHGLETEKSTLTTDLSGLDNSYLRVPLQRFYNAAAKGQRSANPHLHLRKLSLGEAERYLQVVPRADGLDLLFVSYLERFQDDENYISNHFSKQDLERLSGDRLRLENGQEHRHNFEAYGEGYGHVMFLDIQRFVQPVSIGPGIMKDGSDGIPLRRGIQTMRDDGAFVIWCHNKFGLEDIPNWLAGLLDAQNIFDGGDHGSYRDTFYRYLNLGLTVPFSTGTDWFIYDFSRVYVPLPGAVTAADWLRQLRAGRSFITNGPFLDLEVGGRKVGDTIELQGPEQVQIVASGIGREDFTSIELVYNGRVVRSSSSHNTQGHFVASMSHSLRVDQPGWLALRIPLQAGENPFGRGLYAHTSPVYIEMAGQRIFRPQVALELIDELEQSIETINNKGTFADEEERRAILTIYRRGIQDLKTRLAKRDRER